MNNNFCIKDKEIQIFTNIKGCQFEQYKADPFVYSPMVFGIVGISVNGESYKITARLKEAQRFYTTEEVVCLEIEKVAEENIYSLMDDGEMITTPVYNTIHSVEVVTDFQTISKDSDVKEFTHTVGYIFKMIDGLEISFEIGSWYSEMITIRKGYDLINRFTPVEEFYEEWEDTGFKAECRREIKVI